MLILGFRFDVDAVILGEIPGQASRFDLKFGMPALSQEAVMTNVDGRWGVRTAAARSLVGQHRAANDRQGTQRASSAGRLTGCAKLGTSHR
jgi:hypothetical protein